MVTGGFRVFMPKELADLLQRGNDILIGYLYLVSDRLAACVGYLAHLFSIEVVVTLVL